MATFTFTSNQPDYNIGFVAKLIEEYIFRLKGVRVTLAFNLLDPKELELFEKAAGYAITAYEGGWNLKAQA